MINGKAVKVVCYVLALFMLSCAGKAVNTQVTIKTEAKIDSLLNEAYQNKLLNGNVLVVKNGKKIYEKSFGYADGSKTNTLTSAYRFNIGSVYKEFPAVAIMQLHEKGKLKLDDKVAAFLPELPKWSEQVTILNLLQYASGLPEIRWGAHKNISEKDVMQDLLKLDTLAFAPGAGYLYSNNNPYLLTKVIERITGEKFNKYVQQNLFNPNALNNTVIKAEYPYPDRELMAIPFDEDFKEDDFGISVSSVLFSATATDMYQWFHHLNTYKIINKESLNVLAQTADLERDNMQAPLGNPKIINGKIVEHSHHGSSGNYECIVRRFNDEDMTIVILTNQKRRNVYDLSEKIKELVI